MNIATIIAEIPTGVIVVIGLIALVLAIRFRASMSIALAAITLFGTWNAGEVQPVLAILMGGGFYIVLSVIGGIFGGRNALDDDAPINGGYDYGAEQSRLAREYHRRERESRF